MEAGAEHPRADRLTAAFPGRRSVGIDLGTTNSVVAWLDAGKSPRSAAPQLLAIPQLIAPREIGGATTLPSFVYLPTPQERETGLVDLPWAATPDAVVGIFARDHGALVPTRLVSSAKSWLSNPSVDRRDALLPWMSDGFRISPVEASARVLAHLREAWNHVEAAADPPLGLEQQVIVLTVPASFDEEARELTVEAARAAGLAHLTLLEEPIAALYAWISAHPRELPRWLGGGRLLLVCDVGGGTTDLSLVRANDNGDHIQFERVAIGEHLLLGGDNVDLTLASLVERKIEQSGGRLDLIQRQVLRRHCRAAKEQLLAPGAPERVAITILGAGRGVIAGSMTTELTHEEVTSTLDTFLPTVVPGQPPQRLIRPGLRELGLPYESDPAITRHLAAFLGRSARTVAGDEPGTMVRPDAILFNGGFFTPAIARERILEACESWFGTRPVVLANDAPEAAVAIGAAFYGAIRHTVDEASHLLIRAGSPRSYYAAIEGTAQPDAIAAVCVLPRATAEGTQIVLDREFTVIANQPAAFTLLSSADRTDAANAVVMFAADEEIHRHARLVTALRYGQRSRRVPLKVRLGVLYTEIGTIDLWCESVTTEHRWRLQFNLRAQEIANEAPSQATPGEPTTGEASDTAPATEVIIPDDAAVRAGSLLREAFTTEAAGPVDSLVGHIETALGHGKHAWPLGVIRRLADVLLSIPDGRRLSKRHEARWLNLVGFCMRPGFGTSLDPWRISEIRKVYAAGLAYPSDIQCQVEWLILWQRTSAGFTAGQQQELATRMIRQLGIGSRKPPHLNPQMVRESWRLVGGLERIDRMQRCRFGDEIVGRVRREPQNASLLWALGRLGARVPAYGPLNSVVPAAAAENWLEVLRAVKSHRNETYVAVAEIAVRTDDPARDISDSARAMTLTWLEQVDAPPDIIRTVREPIATHGPAPARLFEEPLPLGLRLDER